MRSIWIVRHGDRLDFADSEWARSAERPHDTPLSASGVEQARRLGTRLRPERIGYVFSSPFLRAVETAHWAAEALDLPIKIEPGLSEWLNAGWFSISPEPLPIEELARQFSRVDRSYEPRGSVRYPESGEQALERSGRTAARLAAEFDSNLLMVGHGASVLGATAGLLRVPPERAGDLLPSVPCTGVVKLVQASATWTLELACDTAHLDL